MAGGIGGYTPVSQDPRYEKNPAYETNKNLNPYRLTASAGQDKVNSLKGHLGSSQTGSAMPTPGGSTSLPSLPSVSGGGGVPYQPPASPTFTTESTPYMKEVAQMYRDLIARNRELAGEYDVEDLVNKQRAENSVAMREAEALAGRTGGMSTAEKRNIMDDASRGIAEIRGKGERSKLEFERALLGDMASAIGGASGLAGTEGDFLNRARANEQDLFISQRDYPLRAAEIAASIQNAQMGALAQLAALA